MPDPHLSQYVTELRIARLSDVTIRDRAELLERFLTYTGKPLAATTVDDVRGFQAAHRRLAPASINIYTRHIKAFCDWARRRRILDLDTDDIIIPRVPKGRPHPTRLDDLRTVFACARGALRVGFTLAAFAGLRRGEICALQVADLELSGNLSTALVHGKGGKERVVPLLRPVVDELRAYGLPRAGWVVRGTRGGQMNPDRLSEAASRFFHEIGVATTLHSLRHTFATQATRTTHDLLLVRDLLGHASVASTEIYAASDVEHVHLRLAGLATLADEIRGVGPSDVLPAVRVVGQ
jgi:integrase/recombinase XerC